MRRILAFLGILIVVFFSTSIAILTTAQGQWSTWVYQPDSGRLLHVDSAGQVIASRDLPATDSVYPQTLRIDPTGAHLAYEHPNQQRITVLDLASGTQLATLQLSDIGIAHNASDKLILGDMAFSQDGAHLVYTEFLGGLGWQIHVHDVVQNQHIQTLTFNDEAAGQYPALHGAVRPQVIHINGDRITFIADVDFPVRVHSYHWYYTADILSETVAAPNQIQTAFPYSGDIITVQFSADFPTDNEDFRYRWQQVNTLFAYTGTGGRFPIFFEPSLSFQRLWSIQGGERVLAQGYVNELVDIWVLIDRDGNEIRRYPVAGWDTTGTPNGYIYATDVETQTAIVTVDTRNSTTAGTTLWVQPGNWRIIWAGDNRPSNLLTSWVQLAPATQDPTGMISRYATPTQAPPMPAFREIGMRIQIYVPDEGFLNMRDAPTTNSGVVKLLESGTRGIITDGPVEADGFIWWQISIDGRLGWVVQALPDSLALIPPQLIPSQTPTPTETQVP